MILCVDNSLPLEDYVSKHDRERCVHLVIFELSTVDCGFTAL